MAPTAATEKTAEEPQRYAVYDNTYLRFLDGVYDKKSDAEKAKKDGPEGHDLEVREV